MKGEQSGQTDRTDITYFRAGWQPCNTVLSILFLLISDIRRPTMVTREGGQLIFATERYFIIHSPVTSWTISLNLSCHVSDHLSPRMVTQRSWLVFGKHAGTFIKRVFTSYGILTVQIRPTLLGGASICTMERRIVQESGKGYYRPLPCNGVKLVGYKSLCTFFPGWWGTRRDPSSTGARTARRGKGRRGTEYPT